MAEADAEKTERMETQSTMAEAVTFDNMYFALLGAAEGFRTAKCPDIRKSIHCLEAILICNPPARIEVRTRLQIAQLMWLHTKNVDHVETHLKKAVSDVAAVYTPVMRFYYYTRPYPYS